MIPDSLFSPPQSPFPVLLKVLVSPFSKSRFFFLRVHFPSSPSSFFLSKFSPVLPDSRSRPLPSSSKPKKTAERHEAVPPFSWWLVVGSKTEHSSPPPPLLGTVLTREPRWWHSRRLRHRQKWKHRPHWCQGSRHTSPSRRRSPTPSLG